MTGAGPGRVETLQHAGVTWVDLERPGQEAIQALGERFGFHPLDLEDLSSRTERPKLDRYPDYLFAVFHFPVLLGRPRRLAPGELHLFVGRDFCVTVHDGDLRPVRHLFEGLREDAARREVEMASPGRLAYALLFNLIEPSSGLIDRLSTALETLQEEIFAEATREPVERMALLRREVIQLRRMIRADMGVVDALRLAPFASGPELSDYWDNASDQLHRLSDYLEDVWNTLEALSRSFEQLAAHRTNHVMRVLTAISTIMLPLAVISSIYGMNIRGLPWAESDWAFEITIGIMLAVAGGLVGLFRRRGVI